jgi:hypothetical protein
MPVRLLKRYIIKFFLILPLLSRYCKPALPVYQKPASAGKQRRSGYTAGTATCPAYGLLQVRDMSRGKLAISELIHYITLKNLYDTLPRSRSKLTGLISLSG